MCTAADTVRREREVVDGQPIVGAAGIKVDPANPDRRAVGQVETGEGTGAAGAVGRGVTVEGSDCGGNDRTGEVGGVRIHPRARGNAGRVEAVLEVDLVRYGAAARSEAPLFADVRDVDAGDPPAGAVGERRAKRRYEAAALQSAQRSFSRTRGAEAVAIP